MTQEENKPSVVEPSAPAVKFHMNCLRRCILRRKDKARRRRIEELRRQARRVINVTVIDGSGMYITVYGIPVRHIRATSNGARYDVIAIFDVDQYVTALRDAYVKSRLRNDDGQENP